MNDYDAALFHIGIGDEDAPTEQAPVELPIGPDQIREIREAFDQAGIMEQDKRKALIDSVVFRDVASLRELRSRIAAHHCANKTTRVGRAEANRHGLGHSRRRHLDRQTLAVTAPAVLHAGGRSVTDPTLIFAVTPQCRAVASERKDLHWA